MGLVKNVKGRYFLETPWGPSQSVLQIAPGIYLVDTPGHGGYYCEPHIVQALPEYLRETPYNPRGFFEEDTGWSLLALVRPDLFPAQELAHWIASRYYPTQYARLKEDGLCGK